MLALTEMVTTSFWSYDGQNSRRFFRGLTVVITDVYDYGTFPTYGNS